MGSKPEAHMDEQATHTSGGGGQSSASDLSIPPCMLHGCLNVLLASLLFLMMFELHFAAVIGWQRVSIGLLE